MGRLIPNQLESRDRPLQTPTMPADHVLTLSALIFAAALLYSAVGHGGASGYLAAMALFGLAPLEMKPAALTLNVLVSSIALLKYIKVGRFNWQLFWPFAAVSVPCAFLGGLILLPDIAFRPLIGAVLLYSAWRFLMDTSDQDYPLRRTDHRITLFAGAGLGFLSGLVGVGGGIFLSPLLIMLRWEQVSKVSGIAAGFILVNSIAGLAGFLSNHTTELPDGIVYWGIAAIVGGTIGAELGSKYLGNRMIKCLLALVLVIAGSKMLLTLL